MLSIWASHSVRSQSMVEGVEVAASIAEVNRAGLETARRARMLR